MEKFIYAFAVLAAFSVFTIADSSQINLDDMNLGKMNLGSMNLSDLNFGEVNFSNIDLSALQAHFPPDLGNSDAAEVQDKAKTMLKDKCIKVAGEKEGKNAFEAIEKGVMDLLTCASDLVNITVIQAEIAEAKPKGELDVVFNKYCKKRPEALKCIENFNAKLVPCLEKEERENQAVFMRIVNSLLNFICHKGGDQIALFIAEKGPECLESQRTEIELCINSTFSHYIPKEGVENIKTLPKFVLGEKECDDIQKLEHCVVQSLEKCEIITPANIVESMFRFIKNETVCHNYAKSSAKQNASSVNSLNPLALLFSFVLFYYALIKMIK